MRCLQSSCGRNQLNYMVSGWLNKMALCFHALAMCTRPISLKMANKRSGTEGLHRSHMCKTGQTRSSTPKNGFQVVLKAVVHLVAIVVKRGQVLGGMPQLQILTIISESVLLTCIRLYSGSVGSLATSSHQSQPSLHYQYTGYIL